MKRLTLLLSDIVVLYGALALTLFVRYGATQWSGQYQAHVPSFSILFMVWIFAFYIANLYEERTLRNGRDFYERLAQAITIAAALSIFFFYFIPYFGITPRINLFLFIALFTTLHVGVRSLFNHIIAGGSKKRLLIVGMDGESLELARFITDNPQFGYTVWALARLGQESLPIDISPNWRVVEDHAEIERVIREDNLDVVVLGPQTYHSEELVGIFYRTLAHRVNFASLAAFTEELTGTVPLGAISQSWFLENMSEGSKKSYETFKRGMDILVAVLLGIPTLVIFPFVAAALKITSPGPVLFRQQRTGRGGKPFAIVKFRSMHVDAEKHTGAVWATDNDPRVSRVGKFLRRTRIDELPQLWNILVGQMSVVGPRAERPEIDEKLAMNIPFYHERYLVKPGLSGWAQINYPYGASVQDAIEKLQYDLYYIKRRSLTLDLEIILKTINISLRREGK